MSDSPAATRRAEYVSRRWPLFSGLTAVASVLALGAVIAYREHNLPFAFDTEFNEEMVEHRSAFWTLPAFVMNNIGGGVLGAVVIPIGIIAILLIIRRKWAALFFAVATLLSAGLVQILKAVYDRPRPTDILVTADVGSFPSGHTANAATMAVVLGVIIQRAWVWFAGAVYTIVMLLSRTYLGAHWLSDTVGGLVLGVAVAVVVLAPLAARLRRERLGLQRLHRSAVSR